MVRSGDLVALSEPSEGHLEALWGHSWGTVSAYPFNMLKKPQSSATAEKMGPAAWGGARRGNVEHFALEGFVAGYI